MVRLEFKIGVNCGALFVTIHRERKKLKKGSENKNIQVHTYNKLTLYETLKWKSFSISVSPDVPFRERWIASSNCWFNSNASCCWDT